MTTDVFEFENNIASKMRNKEFEQYNSVLFSIQNKFVLLFSYMYLDSQL